jgi:enoyl-CoA hydratase
VCEPGTALAEAEEMMKAIMSKGPLAVHFALEAVNKGLEMPFKEGCAHEATLFGLLCASEDAKEGLNAFIEKRKPDFKNK